MDNYTYYKEEISELLICGRELAIDNATGKIRQCEGFQCGNCLFHNMMGYNCTSAREAWLKTEYVDKPTLTQDEYKFLSLIKPDNYIARDKRDGALYLYNSGDIEKVCDTWKFKQRSFDCSQQHILRIDLLAADFMILTINLSFIKWEDEKPWKVEDLLKLEVE